MGLYREIDKNRARGKAAIPWLALGLPRYGAAPAHTDVRVYLPRHRAARRREASPDTHVLLLSRNHSLFSICCAEGTSLHLRQTEVLLLHLIRLRLALPAHPWLAPRPRRVRRGAPPQHALGGAPCHPSRFLVQARPRDSRRGQTGPACPQGRRRGPGRLRRVPDQPQALRHRGGAWVGHRVGRRGYLGER